MKSLRKMAICILLCVFCTCSCQTKPLNTVDGTPIDSSHVLSSGLYDATSPENIDAISSETSSKNNSGDSSKAPKKDTSSKGSPNDNSSKDLVSDKPSSSSIMSSNISSDNISSELAPASSETPSSKPSSSGKKYVAFTFDDGPSSSYTKKIVDKLSSYGGAGTFFVVGDRLGSTNGAAIKYAVDNGCEIGIHAYTHNYNYKKCSDEDYNNEITKTADAIHKYLPDYNITLMRPVGGAISSQRVASSPYSIINWNLDTNDWRYKSTSNKTKNVNTIYNNIISSVDNGDIILMHEIYENSYNAFCKAVDKLYNDGYRFVTVTELIGKSNLKPGKLYTHG